MISAKPSQIPPLPTLLRGALSAQDPHSMLSRPLFINNSFIIVLIV